MANQFKAQPLRCFDNPRLPDKKAKPVTKPEPFMSVEQRGARQAEQWSKKVNVCKNILSNANDMKCIWSQHTFRPEIQESAPFYS